MNHLPENDILQISINTYKMLGEYMKYSSKKLILYRCFNCSIFLFNIFFTVISYGHFQSGVYMKSLEGGVTALHTLLKYISFLYYKRDIEDLFDNHRKFWSYQQFGNKLYKDINSIHTTAKNTQKLILTATTCIMTIYCLRPVVNNRARFIFDWWIPSGSIILETVALFSQYYLTILIVPVIFAYDSVYFSFSVHVISQLRLLKCRLENMAVKVVNNEIYECIQHHQLILYLFERMKKIFFWMLLFHYFVTFISGCFQLYTVMTGNIKPIDLLSTITYIISLLLQFAYYSFPAEEIVSELQHISIAIYMSPWLEKNVTQQKLLLFMMMKTQQQRYLSIGGIMDMNVNAFGSVIRKIFSFCTILRNILSN